MLSLRPPYLLVGNLMIFRDDKEEDSFYYACQQPSLSLSEEGQAAISAYAIIPESGVGKKNDDILEAGLSFDVELSTTPEELEEAKKQIQKQFGVQPKAFAPAPLHSGEVYFTMAQSGEEPEKSGWYVTSGFKPSLTGNNKASLVVRTTGDNAKLLIASVDAGSVPACVYYELKLVGVTPVYHASLEADMSLIYHHFEEHKKDNYIFYTEEISKVIDDIHDEKALKVVVEELDPDIKAEAMKTLLDELKSKVIETFFQPIEFPSYVTENQKKSTFEKIGDAIVGIVQSLIPGRQYTKKTIDQSQLKTITIDLSQSNAKTYTYSPQSLLKTMVEQAGVNLSEKIAWISLDDLANKSQEVNVRVTSNIFESSNLKSIEVFCRVLDADTGEVKAEVALPPMESGGDLAAVFNYHRQRGINYCYEYRANLLMDSGTEKMPTLLEIPWTRAESQYININPANFFKDYEVDVYLEDHTMFDQTQMVQVDVTAVIGENEEAILSNTFVFKKDDTEHRRFSIMADKNANLRYNIKLTYYLANLKEQVVEYKDVKSALFFIPNPFENKWSVDIRCKANWDLYERVYLHTRIEDPDRGDPITNRFVFTDENTDQTLYVACGLDTPQETFEYLVEVLPINGDKVLTSGWYQHNGGSVMVLKVMDNFVPKRFLRVQLGEELDYQKLEIQFVEVTIRYADGTEESQRLNSETKMIEFTHIPKDGESSTYSYRYKLKYPGNPKSGWIKSDAEKLLITIDKDLL